AEQHWQVHQTREVDGLRSLELADEADEPEEQESDGEAEPHHHDDFRFYIVQPVVTRDEADAQACDRRHDRPDRDDGGDGRANTAALRPLIAGETPAEPEDGLKLRPVHAGSALEPAQLRF